MPALFTFVALFGGAALLGLKGLAIGPLLMTLAVATLRLYESDAPTHTLPIVSRSSS